MGIFRVNKVIIDILIFDTSLYWTTIRDRDFKIKGTIKFTAALVSHFKSPLHFNTYTVLMVTAYNISPP